MKKFLAISTLAIMAAAMMGVTAVPAEANGRWRDRDWDHNRCDRDRDHRCGWNNWNRWNRCGCDNDHHRFRINFRNCNNGCGHHWNWNNWDNNWNWWR